MGTGRPPGRPRKQPPPINTMQVEVEDRVDIQPRKPAPAVKIVDVSIPDERGELLQTFGVNPELHYTFGAPNKPLEFYEKQGFTVITDGKGNPIRHGADPMLSCPMSLYDARINRAAAVSRAATMAGDEAGDRGGVELERMDTHGEGTSCLTTDGVSVEQLNKSV